MVSTWIPFSPGYDSGANENWESAFVNSTVNNKSQAVGNQNMFLKNVIYLTENTGFPQVTRCFFGSGLLQTIR
jgi:hypothetical protein